MQLREFQNQARTLTVDPVDPDRKAHRKVALLTGAVGDLARVVQPPRGGADAGWEKTKVRDALAEILFRTSAVADTYGLDLGEIAVASLTDLAYRAVPTPAGSFYDDGFPSEEQLPRHISYVFVSDTREDGVARTRIHFDGKQVGDPLTDACARPDGYRLHDAFHLAYATHLGWSPVTRALLNRKRRSNPAVDESEDGGRAIVVEEAASAMVFSHAPANDYFRTDVDPVLLDNLALLAGTQEVAARRPSDWRRAILDGYAMWHKLREHDGHGIVHADLLARTMTFQPTMASQLAVARAG